MTTIWGNTQLRIKGKVESEIQNKFYTKKFFELLKKTALGGAVSECLLKVKNGVGAIKVIDPSGNVYISTEERRLCTNRESFDVGLADINLVIKFLEAIEENEVTFSIKGNFLKFKVKDRENVKFRLVDTEKMMEDYENFIKGAEEINKNVQCEKEIDIQNFSDFVYYGDMFKINSALIEIKSGQLSIGSGNVEKIAFKSSLGEIEFDENLSLSVFGNLFRKVFDVVNNEIPIKIKLGRDCPVIISQKDSYWVFASSEENTENLSGELDR